MKRLFTLLTIVTLAINVNAYDFKVANKDGIDIYYSYIKDGKEVAVTNEGYFKRWNSNKLEYEYYYGGYRYYTNKIVVIPETVIYNERSFPVTKIGTNAFRDSHIYSVTLPNSIKSIDSNSFQDSEIQEIIIPDSITELKFSVFSGCTKLKKVSFPEGLQVIDSYVFDGCSALTTITIPESVTVLKGFTNCTGIKEITIPKNVTNIHFSGCDNLLKIYSYIEDPFEILSYAFSNNSYYSGTLYVPKGTKEKYQSTAGWKSFTFIEEMMPKYTLTYIVDGEEFITYKIEQGMVITPESTPTKVGYTFSGWSGLPEIMPDHDVTVMGTFAINHYNLTYLVDDKEYKKYNLEYGASVIKEANPEREGYTFSGWSRIPETMPARDVTVRGTFTANKYMLTYIVGDKEYKSYEVEYGETIIEEAFPEQEGYTFSGWSEIPETMPAHDVNVTGSFTVNTYKLTYMINDEVYKTSDIIYGTALTPEPEPEKDGFIFSGWSEIPETMPAHNVTVVGTYTEIPYVLSVTITAGKGNVSYNEQSISAGSMEFKLTEGSNATLTITPAPNYKISAVTINGENAMNQLTEGVLTLTDIKADKIVNISFERTSDKYTITMASTMSTLCVDEDLDFTDVSGLEAYIGSGFNMETGTLLMTRVYDVPSGTGLLLKGEPGTYDVPYSTSHSIYVNLLKGLTEGTILEQTLEGCTNYLLSDGAQGLGFYAVNVATVLEAGKAYLPIPTVSAGSRQCIRITYGETTTTGISDMESTEFTTDTYYDMQGRKHIGKPVMRGVYMTNGRKVLVK